MRFEQVVARSVSSVLQRVLRMRAIEARVKHRIASALGIVTKAEMEALQTRIELLEGRAARGRR